jgi:coenzyme F420-reducing hydrogenase beta subunit
MENPSFLYRPRIMNSANDDVRYKGSSGGVITEVMKYLFSTNQIKSSISFKFSSSELFEPFLIDDYSDYNQTGSIYHDVNIFQFLKENIKNIKSPILITCLPCQITPLKRLLSSNNIETFFISLVCSAQLSKEATYYFLDKNNIELKEIDEFRYRGNGWPSGIHIKTKKQDYFFHNNTSKWKYIFHSQVFTLNRCFSCKDTFGMKADISIADPWIDRYVKSEKIGLSIVIAHSISGENLINEMLLAKILSLEEFLTQKEVIDSQKYTLVKKDIYLKNKNIIKFFIRIFKTELYKNNFYYFAKLHHWFFRTIIKILIIKGNK